MPIEVDVVTELGDPKCTLSQDPFYPVPVQFVAQWECIAVRCLLHRCLSLLSGRLQDQGVLSSVIEENQPTEFLILSF